MTYFSVIVLCKGFISINFSVREHACEFTNCCLVNAKVFDQDKKNVQYCFISLIHHSHPWSKLIQQKLLPTFW